MKDKLQALAAQLDASNDYRVLKRFERFVPSTKEAGGSGRGTARGVVVDVETTGLDPVRDKIIEFCGVPFEFERESGRILAVREAVSYLEDPGRPIPAEVTKLTGITDTMVAGKRIDEAAVGTLLADAGLIIAHNAAFDRPFVDRRLPASRDKAWACSQREVPWKELGASSGALEFLMMKRCGLFFDGHRADADCHAVLRLLQEPFDDGTLPMRLLLASARTPSYRIWALGAPFDKKDVLKQRRYRWNNGEGAQPKAWYTSLTEGEIETEEAWLASAVYGGGKGWRVDRLDARSRYAEGG